MVDWEDIDTWISDHEDTETEWKRSEKFLSDQRDDKNDIIDELAALANRWGGRLLIGVDDSGQYEGSWITNEGYDKAWVRKRLDELNSDLCSPPMNLDVEVLSDQDKEIAIISVGRYTHIPHARVKKSNGRVKSRTYRIRTTHGKRFVTDEQLGWLFKGGEEPHFESQFTTCLIYKRTNLSPQQWKDPYMPIYYFSRFINNIKEQDRQTLLGEVIENSEGKKVHKQDKTESLFLEIIPYAIFARLAQVYHQSWMVKERPNYHNFSFVSLPSYQGVQVNFDSFPSPPTSGYLDSFDVDISKTMFSVCGADHILLPPEATIECKWNDSNTVWGIKKSEFFELQIKIEKAKWRAGLSNEHPEVRAEEDSLTLSHGEKAKLQLDNAKRYATLKATITISARFGFPEIDLGTFEKYKGWATQFAKITEQLFSWGMYVDNLPSVELYQIRDGVRKILANEN